jgi:serine-threonine kinase receptor-associated protein
MTDKGIKQIPIVCPGHTRPLAELQYLSIPSENRNLLMSACHDKMPMIRDGKSGNWIGSFQGHKGAVWSCQMDPSGNLAATASGDFSAQVWDAITGQSLIEMPHQHIVKSCVFSPDSKRLATGGKEGLLRIFDLTKLLLDKSSPEAKSASVQLNQAAPITKVAWMGLTQILVACADGKIYLWDVTSSDGTLAHTFDTKQTSEIRDLDVTSAAGKLVMTVAAGNKVYFWDLNAKEFLKEYAMPIHFKDEGGAALHPSGKKFVAGGSDLWVRVFDFETGEELECHKGHHGPIRCVRYSPDGTLYATGSEDGTIRLWKTDPTESQ